MEFELAPQFEIEQYEDIAVDFFRRILDMDYYGCLITDESSLYDFDFEFDAEKDKIDHQTETLLEKVKQVYGLDVSDLEDLFLIDIFKRIRILG